MYLKVFIFFKISISYDSFTRMFDRKSLVYYWFSEVYLNNTYMLYLLLYYAIISPVIFYIYTYITVFEYHYILTIPEYYNILSCIVGDYQARLQLVGVYGSQSYLPELEIFLSSLFFFNKRKRWSLSERVFGAMPSGLSIY